MHSSSLNRVRVDDSIMIAIGLFDGINKSGLSASERQILSPVSEVK